MASLPFSSQSIAGFRGPTCEAKHFSIITCPNLYPNLITITPNFRPKIAVVGLQSKRRLLAGFTANSNSSEGNSVAQKSNGVKTSEGTSAQGPPFLTILAGFVVLFLFIWGFGSILTWLFSLVLNPPSK